MRKLPSLALGLVIATVAAGVVAKSATSTTDTPSSARTATISVEQIHRSVDLAALPAQKEYDSF
jgi:hypothetical protein